MRPSALKTHRHKNVVSITAINATTVEVSFDEAIANIDKADFTIDGLTVENAVAKQGDAKTVVLTTSAQEGGKTYTVQYNGAVVGTFSGISSVLPTAITLDTKSVQGVVGKDVTLKATVTVAEGQSKAGIPVTFNVDAANNNLNKDFVVEALTDADGVATYTYTQYAGYEDVVTSYPTGNASLRETGKVYWGVKPILTVTGQNIDNTANGTVKTYTVTYVNELTGAPVSGAKIYVNFQENMDTPVTNDTNAVATDVANGVSVTPSQTATTQKPLVITTNAKGEATFTVSGSNTTATPVVWVDGKGSATTADQRFEAIELQAVAEAAKFVGAQYTFKFNKTETFDVPVNGNTVVDNTTAPNKYFEYEVEVLKADGTAYAGGTAVVDIYENIDDSLATSSEARIYGEDKVVKLASGAYKLSLDKDGKAKFKVYSNKENTVATPVVWVDVNDATNQTGKLEKEESNAKAGSAVFRAEVLSSAKLTDSTISSSKGAGAYALNNQVDGTGTYHPEYAMTLKDQAGNDLNQTNSNVIANATYVLTNTGSSEMTVILAADKFKIEQVTNGTAINTNSVQTIAAGQSITVYGVANAATTPNNYSAGHSVALDVTTTTPGDLKVSGSVVTKNLGTSTNTNTSGTPLYDVNGKLLGYVGGTNSNIANAANYFSAGEITTQFVNAPKFDENQSYTGIVAGYVTKKPTAGGHVIVKLDGSNNYITIDYSATLLNNLLVGSSLANLSTANENQFETAISLNDTIAYNTTQVNMIGGGAAKKLGLGNIDNSSKSGQTDSKETETVTSYQAYISSTLANAADRSTVTLSLPNGTNEVLNITTDKNVNIVLDETSKVGSLYVNAPNASVTNKGTITNLYIQNVSGNSFINDGTITNVSISDPDAVRFVNNGTAQKVTVTSTTAVLTVGGTKAIDELILPSGGKYTLETNTPKPIKDNTTDGNTPSTTIPVITGGDKLINTNSTEIAFTGDIPTNGSAFLAPASAEATLKDRSNYTNIGTTVKSSEVTTTSIYVTQNGLTGGTLLADGEYKIYFMDQLGNVVGASKEIITVDATAPTAQISVESAVKNDNKLLTNDTVTITFSEVMSDATLGALKAQFATDLGLTVDTQFSVTTIDKMNYVITILGTGTELALTDTGKTLKLTSGGTDLAGNAATANVTISAEPADAPDTNVLTVTAGSAGEVNITLAATYQYKLVQSNGTTIADWTDGTGSQVAKSGLREGDKIQVRTKAVASTSPASNYFEYVIKAADIGV